MAKKYHNVDTKLVCSYNQFKARIASRKGSARPVQIIMLHRMEPSFMMEKQFYSAFLWQNPFGKVFHKR